MRKSFPTLLESLLSKASDPSSVLLWYGYLTTRDVGVWFARLYFLVFVSITKIYEPTFVSNCKLMILSVCSCIDQIIVSLIAIR